MFWIQLVFYLHWFLMIVFAIACLSVIFKPYLLAKLYVIVFLAQQLIRNGCIMTDLENYVKRLAGYPEHQNQFIISYIGHGWMLVVGRVIFTIIIIGLIYSIIGETKWHKKIKKVE